MQTREEIIAGLKGRFDEALSWFAQRPIATFCKGPVNRWTEGQHLDHLILSVKPLNGALRLPHVALEKQFGIATSASETLEKLAARYEMLLAQGGKASGQFVPPEVRAEDKPRLVEDLGKEGQRLVEIAGAWTEADLDKYVLPHPLLGKLSIRDMLLFTYHHVGHHLKTLNRDY